MAGHGETAKWNRNCLEIGIREGEVVDVKVGVDHDEGLVKQAQDAHGADGLAVDGAGGRRRQQRDSGREQRDSIEECVSVRANRK